MDPAELASLLDDGADEVALVSVMWANNEVGTCQPVAELAEIAHEYGVPMHTDAVQAVGHAPLDYAASGVDALALSGHKFGGPVGAGALVLGRGLDVTPLLHGGGQERDIRSGTLDVPAVAALAAATEIAVKRQPEETERLTTRAAPRQRPPQLPRVRGRLSPSSSRCPRHRVLDRLGVLGGGRAAQPRPAVDGALRGARAQLAPLLTRAHVDRR